MATALQQTFEFGRVVETWPDGTYDVRVSAHPNALTHIGPRFPEQRYLRNEEVLVAWMTTGQGRRVPLIWGRSPYRANTPENLVTGDLGRWLTQGFDHHRRCGWIGASLQSGAVVVPAALVHQPSDLVQGSYPMFRDGRIVYCRSGAIECRHWETNLTLWTLPYGAVKHLQIVDEAVFFWQGGYVRCVDLFTGKEIWRSASGEVTSWAYGSRTVGGERQPLLFGAGLSGTAIQVSAWPMRVVQDVPNVTQTVAAAWTWDSAAVYPTYVFHLSDTRTPKWKILLYDEGEPGQAGQLYLRAWEPKQTSREVLSVQSQAVSYTVPGYSGSGGSAGPFTTSYYDLNPTTSTLSMSERLVHVIALTVDGAVAWNTELPGAGTTYPGEEPPIAIGLPEYSRPTDTDLNDGTILSVYPYQPGIPPPPLPAPPPLPVPPPAVWSGRSFYYTSGGRVQRWDGTHSMWMVVQDQYGDSIFYGFDVYAQNVDVMVYANGSITRRHAFDGYGHIPFPWTAFGSAPAVVCPDTYTDFWLSEPNTASSDPNNVPPDVRMSVPADLGWMITPDRQILIGMAARRVRSIGQLVTRPGTTDVDYKRALLPEGTVTPQSGPKVWAYGTDHWRLLLLNRNGSIASTREIFAGRVRQFGQYGITGAVSALDPMRDERGYCVAASCGSPSDPGWIVSAMSTDANARLNAPIYIESGTQQVESTPSRRCVLRGLNATTLAPTWEDVQAVSGSGTFPVVTAGFAAAIAQITAEFGAGPVTCGAGSGGLLGPWSPIGGVLYTATRTQIGDGIVYLMGSPPV